MAIKIKIHKSEYSKTGKYWYTVHAKNHAVRVTSETYKTKFQCMKSAHQLQDELMNERVEFVDETK